MPTFCFRRKNSAPVRDSRPMSRLCLSLAQAPFQDQVVHGHLLEDGGGAGNDGLETRVLCAFTLVGSDSRLDYGTENGALFLPINA